MLIKLLVYDIKRFSLFQRWGFNMTIGWRTTIKIIGIVLMVIGLGLALWGYHLSGFVVSQITTGSDTEKIMTFYITGAVSFVVGTYLIMNKLIQFWINLRCELLVLPFLIVLSSVVYAVVLIPLTTPVSDRDGWPSGHGYEEAGGRVICCRRSARMMTVMGHHILHDPACIIAGFEPIHLSYSSELHEQSCHAGHAGDLCRNFRLLYDRDARYSHWKFAICAQSIGIFCICSGVCRHCCPHFFHSSHRFVDTGFQHYCLCCTRNQRIH